MYSLYILAKNKNIKYLESIMQWVFRSYNKLIIFLLFKNFFNLKNIE